MPEIGRTDIAANPVTRGNQSRGPAIGNMWYTAIAGDVVTLFSIYGHQGVAGFWSIAVYTTLGTTLDARINAPVTITPTNTTPQWWTAVVSIALTAGIEYGIAIGLHSSPTIYEDTAPAPITTMANDNTPPDPWVHAGNSGAVMSGFATVGAPPPPVTGIIYPCRAQLIT